MGCITQDVITMHLGLPDARYATPYSTFGSNQADCFTPSREKK